MYMFLCYYKCNIIKQNSVDHYQIFRALRRMELRICWVTRIHMLQPMSNSIMVATVRKETISLIQWFCSLAVEEMKLDFQLNSVEEESILSSDVCLWAPPASVDIKTCDLLPFRAYFLPNLGVSMV